MFLSATREITKKLLSKMSAVYPLYLQVTQLWQRHCAMHAPVQ